ncbi:MAG TPA: UPF0182 family protein [Longimicrobiales bacterium]
MTRRPARPLLLVGAILLLLLVGGRTAVELYTDALWYQGLGYLPVFWTRLAAAAGVRLAAGGVAAVVILANLWIVARRLGPIHLRRTYGNIEIAEQVPRSYVLGGSLAAAVLAGWWFSGLVFGGDEAIRVLAWIRHVEWGVTDPLFGRDLSFYVFSLPIYFRIIDYLLLITLWSIALVLLGYVLAGSIRWRDRRLLVIEEARLHFVVLAAIVVLLLGARYWLGRHGLLLEGTGIGGGLGYTDVNARLPARRILAVLAACGALGLIYGAWRRSWVPALVGISGLAVAAIVLGQLFPAFVQKFQVEPNQLAREAPYIEWNLEFTRRAYNLHEIERRRMDYRPGALPEWKALAPRLAQLPLWDPEPLETTFNEVESIRRYYRFADVDYDRYGEGVERRQVAVAVREFHPEGLPPEARTWQTLHLNPTYVRGMGAVVSPTASRAPSGEPFRWLRNLQGERDPAAPSLFDLANPSVYFGEIMGRLGGGNEYIVLEPRRDSASAQGASPLAPAGIRLGSFGRVLAFAWRFRDKNLLFSGELTRESRIVFRRAVHDRVAELAPFLLWDPDAQPVISGGRIRWILDGYTASATFPLSRRLEFVGRSEVRYLRGSVKAVVDAVTGEVGLYGVDDADPLLATYERIFPGLIQPLSAMPAELRPHLRYPRLYLLAQAEILKEYHVERPEIFYAGQDLWQLPGAGGPPGTRPYLPIHALLTLPGEAEPEFLLPMPLIARERQNMTAVLVARSDPPHYGELVLLELPRDQQVPGPNQVEALVEADPAISPQLSLWRQAGGSVHLGQLRVVPLEGAFLYVQPIFLSARESPIPELARVVVSDGRAVSMASTLEEAVRQLGRPGMAATAAESDPEPDPSSAPHDWSRRALELLDQAEQRLRNGDWAGFGESWGALRSLLQRASRGGRRRRPRTGSADAARSGRRRKTRAIGLQAT